MLHFSNQELAETYHVSVRTVRNWIEAAKLGKLELTLHEQGKRTYIANTSKNISVMEKLALKGKKYRPHRAFKVITPNPKFYELYSQEQIYDIVSNLEIHHEVLLQYSYFDGGVNYWENYTDKLSQEESPNMFNSFVELLSTNWSYLDALLEQYSRVNIIDVGVGNALPAKILIDHLLADNKMGRYIGVDISKGMLELAKRNVATWYGDKVTFEGYARNILHERFRDILTEEHIKKESENTINIILFLGGTSCNFRDPEIPFWTIHDSMGSTDILLHHQKLDSPATRRYFDFSQNPGSAALATNHRLIFDLLNIKDSWYDVETGFDKELNQRYIRARFNIALTIKFTFDKGELNVDFEKGDSILLFRYIQSSALEVLSNLNTYKFNTLHSSQTSSQEYILNVARIKRD